MLSRTHLSLGVALVTLGLCCICDPGVAVEAQPLASADVDDIESADSEGNEKERSTVKRTRHISVDANGDALPAVNQVSSFAVTSGLTAEAEQVVVTGSFDVNPVEYPALPEVHGTKINSGKKTSFVKPEEFPTVANNDYREVTATTPGLIVSEEPTSPIVNFGYRGLDSQRAEFTQVLKDGLSIKNEQFGFPETHYTPILDAVEDAAERMRQL